MGTYREEKKLYNMQQDYKKKCLYCGHSITFYAFEPSKKLCSYCGRYNYKNEFEEFKDKLKKEVNNVR